jgi:hypothetical protein
MSGNTEKVNSCRLHENIKAAACNEKDVSGLWLVKRNQGSGNTSDKHQQVAP